MALPSTRYSERPPANPLDGTELFVVSQSTAGALDSVKVTLSAIGAYFRTLLGVWSKNQSVTPFALISGSSVPVDASKSNNFKLTMAGDCMLANPTNLTEGMVLNFAIDQDGTGARVLTFDTLYKFPGGAAPTWGTTASAKNFVSCYYDGAVLRCSGGAGYA